jgi:predicted nucleotide-binding protein
MRVNGDCVKAVLELEALSRTKAIEEINSMARRAEEDAVRECASRGILQSGIFGGKIVAIHRDRAKQAAARIIAIRRESLTKCPELATPEHFETLTASVRDTIDGIVASIPEHLNRRGFQPPTASPRAKDETAALSLKAEAVRDIEILKKEFELTSMSNPVQTGAKDRRKVWVVHGRNSKARDATFTFLRAIGLEPMEWNEALALTGKGSPYTGEVLDRAFEEAQAVVVLVTGDDVARLGTRYVEAHDPPEETDPTPQARPNVIFEAGMAFGKYPDRTVIVYLGRTRPFSDVVGRNVLYINNRIEKRQGLADRLRIAGCEVRTDNRTDWHTAGDFDGANQSADLPLEESTADADLIAFHDIKKSLLEKQANHYTPEIGSAADAQAERLVRRGLLKPGPMGGYMIARYF